MRTIRINGTELIRRCLLCFGSGSIIVGQSEDSEITSSCGECDGLGGHLTSDGENLALFITAIIKRNGL